MASQRSPANPRVRISTIPRRARSWAGLQCPMDRVSAIQVFIRVVETSSFSRAAAELGITQPTATKAVAATENRLGVRLLHRSTRGVTLTEAGQLYYEKCKAIERAIDDAETKKLLEPWFGPGLPVEALPLPRLIAVTEDGSGYDAEGLRQRLAAEAPGAMFDDHTRWRKPMAIAASRLRLLGWLAIGLIGLAMAAMITLAANASLAANAQVISVLRLVGARDSYIARAFVRRFTLRAFAGAATGAVLAMLGVAMLPSADAAGAFLTGLGFQGAGWLLPLALPPLAGLVAFAATRFAAFRKLKELH